MRKFILTILLAACVAGARADDVVSPDSVTLGEVTVTAIKQGNDDRAAAATVVTRAQAERLGTASVKDATALMPGVFQPDYGSRMTSTIYVRGVGTRIDQPAVGLNVDNVPVMCKENYDLDLPDLVRVEVLRGPQSTLYGRNTLGGVINVYTLSPMNWQGTRALLEGGSHGLLRAGVSHYARPQSHLAFSASVLGGRADGETVNRHTGRLADWEQSLAGRAKAEWRPDASLLLTGVLAAAVNRQGGYPYEQVGTGMVSYNDTCRYRRTSLSAGLTVTKRRQALTLSSITTWQYINDRMTLDQDFTAEPYFTLTQARREHALTQELVLRGEAGGATRWLAGAFSHLRRMTMDAPVTFKDTGIAELIERHVNEAMPAYPVEWDTRRFVLGSHFTMPAGGAALYGQLEHRLRRLTLTAGLRLDYEHTRLDHRSTTHTGYNIINAAAGTVFAHEAIDIDDSGRLQKDFLELLPRLAATLDAGRCVLLRAAVSRGSKAGGFNTQMFSDVLQQRLMRMMGIGAAYDVAAVVGYRPEHAWNFEVGANATTWGGQLTVDASLYLMNCRDRQLTVFPEGLTTGRMMTNAGRTRHWGGELALTLRPAQATAVSAAYGYTHATFVDYSDGKADYSGRRVPYAPEHTLWAEATHRFALRGSRWAQAVELSANVSGAGRIWWNEANALSQPFYAMLGASATLAGQHYSLQLWGRNLTATAHNTFYFVSIGHEFVQRARSRAIGATLRLAL